MPEVGMAAGDINSLKLNLLDEGLLLGYLPAGEQGQLCVMAGCLNPNGLSARRIA